MDGFDRDERAVFFVCAVCSSTRVSKGSVVVTSVLCPADDFFFQTSYLAFLPSCLPSFLPAFLPSSLPSLFPPISPLPALPCSCRSQPSWCICFLFLFFSCTCFFFSVFCRTQVVLFDESPQPVMQTHHCLAGTFHVASQCWKTPYPR